MVGRVSFWRRIPTFVVVGLAVGGVVGAWVGHLLCFAYDFWKGPFLPQAGVDPNPAGWEGWWLMGGAVAGAAVGLGVAAAVAGLVRLARGPRV